MDEDFTKAKNIVFRLLNIRLRSEKEVQCKLKHKRFSDDICAQTIAYFKHIGLIDDQSFARKWIMYRLARPFGASRIKLELKDKGINPDTIEKELIQALAEFPQDDIAIQLAQKKALKYQGVDPLKKKQRIYGFLARRGFKVETILKALKKIWP